mmetsp:Transcript_16300/g.30489  ORF Transcript_16300/g.30489 Transcript_16300/m.30489 type:complete len:262 (+) Transcript_16300:71-856(+)
MGVHDNPAPGSQFDIIPLEPGCPWYSWSRPNVKWCEENLCAWITAPANTWSNVAYILFGLIMMRQAKKMKSPTLHLFGPASIITGVSSFAFHASYTYVFQIFDYFGMFCFVYLAIVVNFRRSNVIARSQQKVVFWSLVVVSTVLVPILGYFDLPYQLLVLGLVFFTLGQEIHIWRMSRKKGSHVVAAYGWNALGLLFLLAGVTCSALDATRVWCDPKNHLYNGHALWHLLTSIGLFCFFQFYKQFAWDKGMKGLPVVVVDA